MAGTCSGRMTAPVCHFGRFVEDLNNKLDYVPITHGTSDVLQPVVEPIVIKNITFL